jgi:predicted DNA-binding transcriptional regulator YafY
MTMPGTVSDVLYAEFMRDVWMLTRAGRSAAWIAMRKHVTPRTVYRYRARLRARGML